MDETPSLPAEKSPQIKLTLPTTEPIKNLFSRSPSPSPTQKRKQLLPPMTTTTTAASPTNDPRKAPNFLTKCDTPLNVGSATGTYHHFSYYCCCAFHISSIRDECLLSNFLISVMMICTPRRIPPSFSSKKTTLRRNPYFLANKLHIELLSSGDVDQNRNHSIILMFVSLTP